jgi:hypothetical protein
VSVKFHKANEAASATTTTAIKHDHDLTPLPAGPTVEDMEDEPHKKEETLEVAPK